MCESVRPGTGWRDSRGQSPRNLAPSVFFFYYLIAWWVYVCTYIYIDDMAAAMQKRELEGPLLSKTTDGHSAQQ